MYIQIEDLKKTFPKAQTMVEYVDSLVEDEPTIIFRNYNEPDEPPCLESNVQIFDFDKNPRTLDDISNAYGTRPNVPGMNVINAVKAALGPGGYAFHVSDGSYTGYSLWELKDYLSKFDHTDLRVWIAQTFDCDDFSQVLQGSVNGFFPGIAFGTIWYGPNVPDPDWGHSVNIFYSYTDNKVYLIEPQDDTFYAFDKKKWKAWMVVM